MHPLNKIARLNFKRVRRYSLFAQTFLKTSEKNMEILENN